MKVVKLFEGKSIDYLLLLNDFSELNIWKYLLILTHVFYIMIWKNIFNLSPQQYNDILESMTQLEALVDNIELLICIFFFFNFKSTFPILACHVT